MEAFRMLNAGEQGLVVEFGQEINREVNRQVQGLADRLTQDMGTELIELVPTYRSLFIYFDPLCISRQELQERITALLEQGAVNEKRQATSRVISIPVCYGGEYGPDIGFVAAHNGLTEEEVVTLHTSRPYLVYMLGFMPGFPYLGGMPEKLATPRLAQPRTKIPAGSVGIAGSQTGFYPFESPGGWQLIGRTPVRSFSLDSGEPFLFAAGDYLKFEAVSEEEYRQIRQLVADGRYQATVGSFEGGDTDD